LFLKNIIVLSFTVLMFLIPATCLADLGREPTAIVIDDETDKPIEGAVALCIWRKSDSWNWSWFEGGMEVPRKIVETVSDKEGRIYISGYWNWHMFKERYPRLDVYKPGYICWDQSGVYISETKGERRTDFNKSNRIIRLKKRPEDFSFISHSSFINSCTSGNYNMAKDELFYKAIETEYPFEQAEYDKRVEQIKKLKKEPVQ
jgi:hypothetical protein